MILAWEEKKGKETYPFLPWGSLKKSTSGSKERPLGQGEKKINRKKKSPAKINSSKKDPPFDLGEIVPMREKKGAKKKSGTLSRRRRKKARLVRHRKRVRAPKLISA